MAYETTASLATIYVWEKYFGQDKRRIFDLDFMLQILGGQQPPTEKELDFHTSIGRLGVPMHCTPDFRIYPIT
ncbi:hypothetical protein J4405_02820 [Candidatus Woesearchaeota archaeon]|nr:hypothetical protein [Candidatus Woesearchaeota archaeon]